GVAVEEVGPPGALRERIMAAGAVPPPGQDAVGQTAPHIIALPVATTPEPPLVETHRVRRSRPRAVAYGAAAAVIAAGIAALAGLAVNLNNQLHHAMQPPSVYALQGTNGMAAANGQGTVFQDPGGRRVGV